MGFGRLFDCKLDTKSERQLADLAFDSLQRVYTGHTWMLRVSQGTVCPLCVDLLSRRFVA